MVKVVVAAAVVIVVVVIVVKQSRNKYINQYELCSSFICLLAKQLTLLLTREIVG